METSGGSAELKELRELLAQLTQRVYRLEQALAHSDTAATKEIAATHSTLEAEPQPSPIPLAKPKPAARSAAIGAVSGVSPRSTDTPATRESDLESRIGSHWLNRIGIAAVLIGVSYFLKFAFDNNWIGPAGRVTIGLIAGVAIVVWSEHFRRHGYKVFSYSLKAVGVGVLYLSIWAAVQVYALVSSTMAFVTMMAVTASTAAMALNQDAEILATFALMGGFLTPVLLSTGQNREFALFSYVAVLDIASLVFVVVKPWRRQLILSYAGTLLLYIGWYSRFYDLSQIQPTVAFATVFFIIFALAPLLASQAEDSTTFRAAAPFLLAFINGAAYFFQIYAVFEDRDTAGTAWFALALAVLYILLSRFVRIQDSDPAVTERFRLLHLALAIGFITIAVPIALHGHWITIGWFIESAALLWVGDRIRSDLLHAFAMTALGLGVVRLLFFDDFYSLRPIFNQRMATYTLAIAVLGAVAWYAAKRGDGAGRKTACGAIIALNLLALVALSREVADYYAQQMAGVRPGPGDWDVAQWAGLQTVRVTRDFTYSALWMSYGAMLMVIGFWRRSAFVRWQALVLIAATTVKVFVYDVSQLDRVYRILSFVVLGILLLAISFVYQRDWLRLSPPKAPTPNLHKPSN